MTTTTSEPKGRRQRGGRPHELGPALGHGGHEQVEGPSRRAARRLGASRGRFADGSSLADQRHEGDDQQQDDHEEPASDSDRGSLTPRSATLDEPSDQRIQRRREDGGDDDWDHDHRHDHEDDHHHRDQAEGHEQAPAPLCDPIEPRRHQDGKVRARPRVHDRHRGRGDSEQHGRDRHRREQADDPGELETGRQRQEHHRRVHAHGSSVDRRPDEVAEDDVAHRNQQEQEHGRPRAERRVGHQQDDPGRDDAAEVGDVAEEEDEDGEGDGQGDPQDQHEHEVGDGDDRGQERRAPEVAAHADQGIAARLRDPLTLLVADGLEDPDPGLVAIAEEEEHEERGEDHHRDDPRRGRDEVTHDVADAGADAIDGRLDLQAELRREADRAAPRLQLVDARDDPVHHLGGIRHEDQGEQEHRSTDHAHGDCPHDRGSRGPGPPAGTEAQGEWGEGGCDDDRDGDGRGDRPQERGQHPQDGDERRDDDDPPAEGREVDQPAGDDLRQLGGRARRHRLALGSGPRSSVATRGHHSPNTMYAPLDVWAGVSCR